MHNILVYCCLNNSRFYSFSLLYSYDGNCEFLIPDNGVWIFILFSSSIVIKNGQRWTTMHNEGCNNYRTVMIACSNKGKHEVGT
jgi:hypothetical protein